MRTLCPACVLRHAHLVSSDCTICRGNGTLVLGPAALSLYDPAVVSRAIALALQAAARTAAETLTLSDARKAPLRTLLAALTAAGVLAKPAPPAPRPVTTLPRRRNAKGQFAIETTPAELAAASVEQMVLPIDETLAFAPRFIYREADRPNARGLPVLSANGHPGSLRRVFDP